MKKPTLFSLSRHTIDTECNMALGFTRFWQWMNNIQNIVFFTARKRSLGKGNVLHLSVSHSVYMGVSVWCYFLSSCLVPCSFWRVSVSGPMFLLGGLCVGGLCLERSLSGGLCPGVSVKGVSVKGGLCPGGLCPVGVSVREIPRTVKSGR